jgi:hypothetical protein
MIDLTQLMKYIQKKGYRTESEIRDQYKEDDYELLDATLMLLASRNVIKKIQYQAPTGSENLFYVV